MAWESSSRCCCCGVDRGEGELAGGEELGVVMEIGAQGAQAVEGRDDVFGGEQFLGEEALVLAARRKDFKKA